MAGPRDEDADEETVERTGSGERCLAPVETVRIVTGGNADHDQGKAGKSDQRKKATSAKLSPRQGEQEVRSELEQQRPEWSIERIVIVRIDPRLRDQRDGQHGRQSDLAETVKRSGTVYPQDRGIDDRGKERRKDDDR